MIATKNRIITVITIIAITSGMLLFAGCFNPGSSSVQQPEEQTQPEPGQQEEAETQPEPEQEQTEPQPEQGQQQEEESIEEQPVEESESWFAYAILSSHDGQDKTLYVEQLINEPNQQELGEKVTHASDCQAVLSVLVREGGESEHTRNIDIESIPTGQEVGLVIGDGVVEKIIYQLVIDAGQQAEVKEIDPRKEFFVNALLKGVVDNNTLEIEQLINEPNQQEIGEQVTLAENFQAYFSVVLRSDGQEKEYVNTMDLQKIPRNHEIGLIVNQDMEAVAAIYSMLLEQ